MLIRKLKKWNNFVKKKLMQIIIDIPESKAQWILALLNDIPEVKILTNKSEPEKSEKLAALAGSWQPKLSLEEIEARLQEQKDEWQ